MSWTLQQILSATGGKLMRPAARAAFGEVVTDSKKVAPNSVFVALKGRKFDGHRFAKDAARRGAACLIVHKRVPLAQTKDAAVVRVKDTLEALGALGHYRRMQLNPKVLAITGSNGKTTTKEMVAAILERATLNGRKSSGSVLKTEGNYNNLVGLPLTLLRLSERDRAAVVELGTSNPGEIARLTRIAAPDVAIVTSVGPAHLSGLKSVAGVAREKGSIYRGLRRGGVAVVNLDDPRTRQIGAKLKGKKITYGKQGGIRAEDARPIGDGGTAFVLRIGGKRARVRLHLPGDHNLVNALGAAAMAHAAGVDLRAIRAGLEAVRPFSMRMAVERWSGLGIINDAYNANPASMEAALKTLARMNGGRKIAVVGDMLELGGETRRRHLEVGRQAAECGIDRLYIFGRQARLVRQGALAAGMASDRVAVGKTHGGIASSLQKEIRAGDWILFKGSRGMRMEKILGALKARGA